MGNMSIIDEMMERKLTKLHTVYIGKVLSVNKAARKAKIQPLTMFQQVGQSQHGQKPVTAYIPEQAMWTPKPFHIVYVKEVVDHVGIQDERDILEYEELKSGDTVICAACEREISQTVSGSQALPSKRRHDLSDSVVLGCLKV